MPIFVDTGCHLSPPITDYSVSLNEASDNIMSAAIRDGRIPPSNGIRTLAAPFLHYCCDKRTLEYYADLIFPNESCAWIDEAATSGSRAFAGPDGAVTNAPQ